MDVSSGEYADHVGWQVQEQTRGRVGSAADSLKSARRQAAPYNAEERRKAMLRKAMQNLGGVAARERTRLNQTKKDMAAIDTDAIKRAKNEQKKEEEVVFQEDIERDIDKIQLQAMTDEIDGTRERKEAEAALEMMQRSHGEAINMEDSSDDDDDDNQPLNEVAWERERGETVDSDDEEVDYDAADAADAQADAAYSDDDDDDFFESDDPENDPLNMAI